MKGIAISYSENELKWLFENKKMVIGEYLKCFNIKFGRDDVSQSNLHALRKRNGWKTGRTGYYKKGNKPFNTGTTGIMRPNSGSFKKGHVPSNHKPVGSERLNKDGHVEIKIGEKSQWVSKHVKIWEDKYGKIKGGMILTFKDGDKNRIEVDNLELISRNENLQINRLRNISDKKELLPSIRATGKLVAKRIDVKNKKTALYAV